MSSSAVQPAHKDITCTIWKVIPHFPSHSIERTTAFYKNHLYFTIGSDGSSPNFCSVYIGDKAAANIYFYQPTPEAEADSNPADFHPSAAHIAFKGDAFEEYYALLKGEGKVELVRDIADMPWGYKEFTVKDEDGNLLTFFRFLD